MEARERHAARVGSMLDGWRLERLLGWGATSAVYEGNAPDGTRRAIKLLNPALFANESVVRRFLREAYVANTIRHPSMVKVYGDGASDGSIYLVLDLLAGETLEERRLRLGGRLELRDVTPIALDLMSALSLVHAAGIVHRDLKPQNVFVTTDDAVKLIDFGTARVESPAHRPAPLSIEGLVVGTPSFMAPEQARGERGGVDARSDVWSLGATLFMALAGEFVHAGRDAHQRLLAAATKPARSLRVIGPWVNANVAGVVDRALAFDKAERWPDMAAMRSAFALATRVVV